VHSVTSGWVLSTRRWVVRSDDQPPINNHHHQRRMYFFLRNSHHVKATVGRKCRINPKKCNRFDYKKIMLEPPARDRDLCGCATEAETVSGNEAVRLLP